ncbi:MAG: SDR family oxidoreductase [Mycobacterium sp.]
MTQVAIVTGASSGIGFEVASQLIAAGMNVLGVGRDEKKLSELKQALKGSERIETLAVDLTDDGAPNQIVESVLARWGRIDFLINNAGVGLHGDFAEQDAAANGAQVQLNCVTLVELTALFLPEMVRAGHGLVLNVASTAAFQPIPGMAVYGATKAFVLSFTEALWQEARGTGVRVLTLCPGATETEFFARTGAEFLTSGRQTSQQVVDTAMAAIGKSTPTVVSGLKNTVLASGYRFAPRRLLLSVSQRMMTAN